MRKGRSHVPCNDDPIQIQVSVNSTQLLEAEGFNSDEISFTAEEE